MFVKPNKTVGMVVFPDMTHLDFAGPYEVFQRIPTLDVLILAKTLDPIRTQHGLRVLPEMILTAPPRVDVIFIPGGPGVNQLMEDPAMLSFLRQHSATAEWITSVCTGSLVLGAAGLLRGYRATSHWMSLQLLESFGAIPTRERVVVDRNRITGAGVSSGIDFALTLTAKLAGEQLAQMIQLELEYDPEPPYQAGSPNNVDLLILNRVTRKSERIQDERIEIVQRAVKRLEIFEKE